MPPPPWRPARPLRRYAPYAQGVRLIFRSCNRNSTRRGRITGQRNASSLRVQTGKAWAQPTAHFASIFVRANGLLLIESRQVRDSGGEKRGVTRSFLGLAPTGPRLRRVQNRFRRFCRTRGFVHASLLRWPSGSPADRAPGRPVAERVRARSKATCRRRTVASLTAN